jgi:tetratricopeptide (TPR) repeat protein
MREDLGDDHWATLEAKCELGRILMARGLLPEADKLISEALHSKRLRRSLAHQIFFFINPLAVAYTKQGKYADANDLFTEALEGRKQTLGENHPQTLRTLNDFGVLRREQKNYPEAEELLRQALAGRQFKLGKDHPACFESMHELAVLYKEQGDYDKAEPLLIDAVEGRRLKLGDQHLHTIESIKNLIDLYEASNKPEKAKEWRAKVPQTDATTE